MQLALRKWPIHRRKRRPKTLPARGHAQLPFQKIFVIGQVAMNPKRLRIAITQNTAEKPVGMLYIVCENVIVSIELLATNGPNRQ